MSARTCISFLIRPSTQNISQTSKLTQLPRFIKHSQQRYTAVNRITTTRQFSHTVYKANMASLITGNKFDPNTDIPDLSGKVFLITGATQGLGLGIASHVLQHKAAKIIMLSNKEQHAKEAIDHLKQFGDTSVVHWVQCDLENLKQVDQVAKKLVKEEKRLDVLVANAGIGVGVYNETVDGIDSHMQVNVFSQMHLIFRLLPLLQSTAAENLTPTRIVMQSSDLHRALPSSGIDFASMEEINTDIGPSYLYNRSKLAMILFMRKFERLRQAGELGFKSSNNEVYGNCSHPGGVATDQQKQAEDAYGVMGVIAHNIVRPFMKDPIEDGCRPALFLATSEEVIKDNVRGGYCVPDKKITEPSSQATDVELGERFFKLAMSVLDSKVDTKYDWVK